MPPKFLGSQLTIHGPSIWPVSDFGAHGTPRSGVKTQGGEIVVPPWGRGRNPKNNPKPSMPPQHHFIPKY